MLSTTPRSHSSDFEQKDIDQPPNVSEICENIKSACEQSVETGDFLSFATLLEFYMGVPRQFSSDEAATILETLHKSLSENPKLVYDIGWDLPEMLLRYVDRFFEPNVSNLPSTKPFRLVMSLFSLICENGNHRELFIKACELILLTEGEKNRVRIENMNFDDEEKGALPGGVQIDMPSDHFEQLDDTKQENVKFCTLFEVMRYSLQNIKTSNPSGYLLEAASTLLQVASDPHADLLAVTSYARRMYLLARDFNVCEDSITPEELVRVQKILVNFLSLSVDVLLRKYSLKYAERLYVQMKNKVALAPPSDRTFVYKESEYTHRLTEATTRMTQLILSYDYDPEQHILGLMGMNCQGERITQPTVSSTSIDDMKVREDNYWAQELIQGPSLPGLLIMNTMLHFDSSREKQGNWKTTAIFSCAIAQTCPLTAAIKDGLLYWALWLSNGVESYVFDDDELLTKYLNTILYGITNSQSPQERFVCGSIVARLLRYQPPEFSYNYCMGVINSNDDSYQHCVVIESLKILITGKMAGPNSNDPTAGSSIELPKGRIVLSDERKLELCRAIQNAIVRVFQKTTRVPYYYLNFLCVVPTVPEVVLEICAYLEQITSSCKCTDMSDGCRVQLQLLLNAVSHLRKQSLESIASKHS